MKRKPKHATIYWSTQKGVTGIEGKGDAYRLVRAYLDGYQEPLAKLVEHLSEARDLIGEHVSLVVDGDEYLCLPEKMGWWPDLPEELLVPSPRERALAEVCAIAKAITECRPQWYIDRIKSGLNPVTHRGS